MLSKGNIQFYINGPPPVAVANGQFFSGSSFTPNYLPTPHPSSLNNLSESKDINVLVNQSHTTLLAVKSMKIFDFFPDHLSVDENKVTIIYNAAFNVKSIHSILIENITYVEAHLSLLCGSLVIVDSSNYRHPLELRIDHLPKEAAVRARKLIQGLVQAKNLQLDFRKLPTSDLEYSLEELGRVTGED